LRGVRRAPPERGVVEVDGEERFEAGRDDGEAKGDVRRADGDPRGDVRRADGEAPGEGSGARGHEDSEASRGFRSGVVPPPMASQWGLRWLT